MQKPEEEQQLVWFKVLELGPSLSTRRRAEEEEAVFRCVLRAQEEEACTTKEEGKDGGTQEEGRGGEQDVKSDGKTEDRCNEWEQGEKRRRVEVKEENRASALQRCLCIHRGVQQVLLISKHEGLSLEHWMKCMAPSSPIIANPWKEHEPRRMNWVSGKVLLKRLLMALDQLHSLGYLHMDIHEGNIVLPNRKEMLGEPDIRQAKVVDFGSAMSLKEARLMHGQGVRGGKWVYCCMEHVRGDAMTPSSDIFEAFAVVASLCFGFPLFQKGSRLWMSFVAMGRADRCPSLDMLRKMKVRQRDCEAHALRDYDTLTTSWPSSLLPAHPFLKALHPDPQRRFQSAKEALLSLGT